MVRHGTLSLLAVGTVLLAPAAARGQTLPSVDATTWRPSMDPSASLILEPVSTPGPWQWSASAWVSYAQAPVALRDATSGSIALRPVAHELGLDLVTGVG